MTMWQHEPGTAIIEPVDLHGRPACVFCGDRLNVEQFDEYNVDDLAREDIAFWWCSTCGWWFVERYIEGSVISGTYGGRTYNDYWGSRTLARSATLKTLDVADVTVPLDEVRRFLLARYDARFSLHPRLFEEVVGAVFKDLGYQADVTAYHADDGIDIILRASDGTPIGVQVKRYRNTICVDQIRALAGALLLRGMTRGVFVTTAGYQRGCENTARRLADRGVPVELIDAAAFLSALRVAQRPMKYERDEVASLVRAIPYELRSQSIGSCNATTSIPIV